MTQITELLFAPLLVSLVTLAIYCYQQRRKYIKALVQCEKAKSALERVTRDYNRVVREIRIKDPKGKVAVSETMFDVMLPDEEKPMVLRMMGDLNLLDHMQALEGNVYHVEFFGFDNYLYYTNAKGWRVLPRYVLY